MNKINPMLKDIIPEAMSTLEKKGIGKFFPIEVKPNNKTVEHINLNGLDAKGTYNRYIIKVQTNVKPNNCTRMFRPVPEWKTSIPKSPDENV